MSTESQEALLDKLLSMLTPAAQRAVLSAASVTHELELDSETPVDDALVLSALMEGIGYDSPVGSILLDTTSPEAIRREAKINAGLTTLPVGVLLETAQSEALESGSTVIGREHLLLAIFNHPWLCAAQILFEHAVFYERVTRRLRRLRVAGRWHEGQDDY